MGVDLLVDDPLLAGMVEAEISCLRPGCQGVYAVVGLVIKLLQRLLPGEVAVLRVQPHQLVPLFFELRTQHLTKKACSPGNKNLHFKYPWD